MEQTIRIEEIALQPPCQEACPLHQDIRGYLAFIAQGQFDKALEVIGETNPLPSICATICAHPCEDKCRRSQVDQPLSIRALKRFAVEHSNSSPSSQAPPKGGHKVAIIGSGPAGLTAAHDLAKAGYQVTVFEREAAPGGILQTAIPLYRLPRDVIQRDIENIKALGVEMRTNMELGKDFTLDDLEGQGYEAVLLGLGLPISRGLPISGMELDGVVLALPFLRDVNLNGFRFAPGKVVIVVGGGNVAIDVARCAIRSGAERVRLACLEARHEMPASSWEIEEALEEGCEVNCSKGPKSVLSRDGKVVGLELMDVKAVFDAEGRFNPTYYEDRISALEGDIVIFAIGQASDLSFLKDSGVELDARGRLILDPETQATSRRGVFACGEVTSGPGIAVQAMASGRKAAQSIARYLKGEPWVAPSASGPTVAGELSPSTIEKITRRERIAVSLLAPEQRVQTFEYIESCYNELAAIREAMRCLSCGAGALRIADKCTDCLTCVRICPYGVPAVSVSGVVEIRSEYCQACGICVSECPAKAIAFRTPVFEAITTSIERALESISSSSTEPAILALCCSYGSCASSSFAEWLAYHRPPNLGLAKIPCVAKIDVTHLLRPFEMGVAGVLVMACSDDECRYPGNLAVAERRVNAAKKILNEIGLSESRLELRELEVPQIRDFEQLLAEFENRLKQLGEGSTE